METGWEASTRPQRLAVEISGQAARKDDGQGFNEATAISCGDLDKAVESIISDAKLQRGHSD